MTRPRRKPRQPRPHPCHVCSAGGCERCDNRGFTIGPTHRPVTPDEITAPMLNLHYARRATCTTRGARE